MKKIIAGIIALTLAGAMLAGCGNVDEAADKTENGISETSSAADNENDENEIGEADDSNDTGDTEQNDDQKPSGSYEDALREYYDASNNGDFEKILRLMYPDKVVDSMYAISELQGTSLVDAIGADNVDTEYEVTEIVEEGKMDSSDLDEIMKTFDMLVGMVELIESYGGDLKNLTDEQREEIYVKMTGMDNTSQEHAYTVTECYDVTVRYLNHGEPDEDYFYVYYVEGEGWKLDNSMRKYVKKSKQASANSNAKTVYAAFITALVEIETDAKDLISGSYIISSDDGKNVNVPASVDVSKLKGSAKKYFPEISDFDYFIIVKNCDCVYAAVYPKDGTGYVGTYPISAIPKALTDHGLETESIAGTEYTLDELYDIAKGIVM